MVTYDACFVLLFLIGHAVNIMGDPNGKNAIFIRLLVV